MPWGRGSQGEALGSIRRHGVGGVWRTARQRTQAQDRLGVSNFSGLWGIRASLVVWHLALGD